MRVAITDLAALSSVTPSALISYLRVNGWAMVADGDRFSIWTKEAKDSAQFELLVPQVTIAPDYGRRIAEAVKSIAANEDRSELEVLSDLSLGSADVIRIGVKTPGTNDGLIDLPHGLALVSGARDMIIAAACAAVDPRAIYGKRKPDRAIQLGDQARLGQTERGSYVVTVIVPVPPLLRVEPGGDLFPETLPEPFEREVTTLLNTAVDDVKKATHSALTTGRFDGFTDAVRRGVSANLCEAISQMAGRNAPLELRFNWSSSRPSPRDAVQSVSVEAHEVEVINEAARIFRETSPRQDYELHGMVTRLARDEGSETGTVGILALIDDGPRQVRITLGRSDYDVALAAHHDEQPIMCIGTLQRDGQTWELREVREFRIV